MKIFFRSLLAIAFLLMTYLAYAGDSDAPTSKDGRPLPQPNWVVLLGKPLKTTVEGNKRIDIFEAEGGKSKKLDYAWATCASVNGTCTVIIWIRGDREDTRIIYEGKKKNNVCTIYIPRRDFDKQFKYCTLSGIKCNTDKGFVASFGGGPSGDRDDYWFEWGDPSYVKPDFYCILK